MPTVGALEFQRKFGEFQHQAQREPVEITRHGRREYVLMSAEHDDWLKAAAQRTHRTIDAADVVLAAVERAEMEPGLGVRYDYLWTHEAARRQDQGKDRPAWWRPAITPCGPGMLSCCQSPRQGRLKISHRFPGFPPVGLRPPFRTPGKR